MTVYVDNMLRSARPAGYRGAGTPRWSHLFADTTDELLEMAGLLGLRERWIQNVGTHREHFDVVMAARGQALGLGAVALSYPRGVADLMERRREVCRCRSLATCQWSNRVALLAARGQL